jgi:hypothetical protein
MGLIRQMPGGEALVGEEERERLHGEAVAEAHTLPPRLLPPLACYVSLWPSGVQAVALAEERFGGIERRLAASDGGKGKGKGQWAWTQLGAAACSLCLSRSLLLCRLCIETAGLFAMRLVLGAAPRLFPPPLSSAWHLRS